jgi:hypothetical protein
MRRTVCFAVIAAALTTVAVRAQIAIPSTFLICISASGTGSDCYLPGLSGGQRYSVTSTLAVERPVTVWGDRGATVTALERDSPFPDLMISLNVSNSEVYRMDFYGGGVPPSYSTSAEDVGSGGDNNEIAFCNFYDSPGYSIDSGGSAALIAYNTSYWAGFLAVRSGGTGATILGNDIEYGGGDGLILDGYANNTVTSNYLYNNTWNYTIFNISGGQMDIEDLVNSVTASTNFFQFDASDVPWTSNCCWTGGIESHGAYVYLYNNSSAGHTGAGIYFWGGTYADVRGYDPTTQDSGGDSWANTYDGVAFTNVSSVNLDDVNSQSNGYYGIRLQPNGTATTVNWSSTYGLTTYNSLGACAYDTSTGGSITAASGSAPDPSCTRIY